MELWLLCGEWVFPREDARAQCQLDWKLCWSLPGPASQLLTAGWGLGKALQSGSVTPEGTRALVFPGRMADWSVPGLCSASEPRAAPTPAQGLTRMLWAGCIHNSFGSFCMCCCLGDSPGCHGLAAHQAREQLPLPSSNHPSKAPSLAAAPLGQALEGRAGLMEAPPPAQDPWHLWCGPEAQLPPESSSQGLLSLLSLLSSDEGRATYSALYLVSSPAQVEEKDVQLWQGRRTHPSLEFSAFDLYSSAFLMKVKATDADEGINGRVWYRIVKGKSSAPSCIREFVPGPAQPQEVELAILLHFGAHKTISPSPMQNSALGLIAGE